MPKPTKKQIFERERAHYIEFLIHNLFKNGRIMDLGKDEEYSQILNDFMTQEERIRAAVYSRLVLDYMMTRTVYKNFGKWVVHADKYHEMDYDIWRETKYLTNETMLLQLVQYSCYPHDSFHPSRHIMELLQNQGKYPVNFEYAARRILRDVHFCCVEGIAFGENLERMIHNRKGGGTSALENRYAIWALHIHLKLIWKSFKYQFAGLKQDPASIFVSMGRNEMTSEYYPIGFLRDIKERLPVEEIKVKEEIKRRIGTHHIFADQIAQFSALLTSRNANIYQICDLRRCPNVFIKHHGRQKFCCNKCKDAVAHGAPRMPTKEKV